MKTNEMADTVNETIVDEPTIMEGVLNFENINNWKMHHPNDEKMVVQYTSNIDFWTFIIVGYKIDDQGFPEGTIGYDCVAYNKEYNVRFFLPREAVNYKLKEILRKNGN